MFKNRSLKVSLEKTPSSPQTASTVRRNRDDILFINSMIQVNVQKAAVGFVAVYGAVKFISTASEIATNIAPKR